MEKLTKREFEVLGLMAQGMSNKEIMKKLCISRGTIVSHIHHINDKLGLSCTTKDYSVKRVKAVLWYSKHVKETKLKENLLYINKELAKISNDGLTHHVIQTALLGLNHSLAEIIRGCKI